MLLPFSLSLRFSLKNVVITSCIGMCNHRDCIISGEIYEILYKIYKSRQDVGTSQSVSCQMTRARPVWHLLEILTRTRCFFRRHSLVTSHQHNTMAGYRPRIMCLSSASMTAIMIHVRCHPLPSSLTSWNTLRAKV